MILSTTGSKGTIIMGKAVRGLHILSRAPAGTGIAASQCHSRCNTCFYSASFYQSRLRRMDMRSKRLASVDLQPRRSGLTHRRLIPIKGEQRFVRYQHYHAGGDSLHCRCFHLCQPLDETSLATSFDMMLLEENLLTCFVRSCQ